MHTVHTLGFYDTARNGLWAEASRHAREASVRLQKLIAMRQKPAKHIPAYSHPNDAERTVSWHKLCGMYASLLASLEFEHSDWQNMQLEAQLLHADCARVNCESNSRALDAGAEQWRASASNLYERLCDHCATFERAVSPGSIGAAAVPPSAQKDHTGFGAKVAFDREAATATAAVGQLAQHRSVAEHVGALLRLGCGVALICLRLLGAHRALQALQVVLESYCSQLGGPNEYSSQIGGERGSTLTTQASAGVEMLSAIRGKRPRVQHVIEAMRPLDTLLDEALRQKQPQDSCNACTATVQTALAWTTALGVRLLIAAGASTSYHTEIQACGGNTAKAILRKEKRMALRAQMRSENEARSHEEYGRGSQEGLLDGQAEGRGQLSRLISMLEEQLETLELLCSVLLEQSIPAKGKGVTWEELFAPECGYGGAAMTSAVAAMSLRAELLKLRHAAASCMWLTVIKRDDVVHELLDIHKEVYTREGVALRTNATGAAVYSLGHSSTYRSMVGRGSALECAQLWAAEAVLLLESFDLGNNVCGSAKLRERVHALDALLSIVDGRHIEHSSVLLERRCGLERSSTALWTLLGALRGKCRDHKDLQSNPVI